MDQKIEKEPSRLLSKYFFLLSDICGCDPHSQTTFRNRYSSTTVEILTLYIFILFFQEKMDNLKKYLDDQWLSLIQNKKNRPNKQAVKETVEHYAWQDEKERADEEVINSPMDENQDYAEQVSAFISQYVDENWTN